MLSRIDGEILPQDFVCILIDVRGVAFAVPSSLIAWFEALSIQTSRQPGIFSCIKVLSLASFALKMPH